MMTTEKDDVLLIELMMMMMNDKTKTNYTVDLKMARANW